MNKLLSILGLCRRAGRLEIGFDCCEKAIKSSKAKLVICANDLSTKTQKELNFSAEKNGGTVKILKADFDKFALSNAIGTSAGVVAICDDGFAKKASELYETGGSNICQ